MPYQGGRLPAETASKLGHLEVLQSDLVNEICENFESLGEEEIDIEMDGEEWDITGEKCTIIFGVDGSFQTIFSDGNPKKALSFIKTAMLRLDIQAIEKLDPKFPHPLRIRDILKDAAVYHATVFPLQHISTKKMSLYHAIRKIVDDFLKDPTLDKEVYETLKWIMYQKWQDQPRNLPIFDCPHCRQVAVQLTYNADEGKCDNCSQDVRFSDVLGIHIEIGEDYASGILTTNYMGIHETLLLFTGVRYFWENHRNLLSTTLFVKDGPLYLRAHFTKMVNPIRRFLQYAKNQGTDILIVGQEKSGAFFEHLEEIAQAMPSRSVLIPGNEYIRKQIQKRPLGTDPYGYTSNYGAKLLVKYDDYHHMVLNIPTGDFVKNPEKKNIIGFSSIMSTLPSIFSAKHESGLLPIELAHSVASLSTYPSAKILSLFAEDKGIL